MKSITLVIILMISALIGSDVVAEIYSWTDENGVKHYSHDPPSERGIPVKTAPEIKSDPSAYALKEVINETNIETVIKQLDQTEAAPPQRQSPQKNRRPARSVLRRKRKNCRKKSPGWNNSRRKRMPIRAANRPSSAATVIG